MNQVLIGEKLETMYKVILKKQAEKYYNKVSNNIALKLKERFTQMMKNPIDINSKQLKGELQGYWRSRLGSLRIIYSIDESNKTINIALISSRGDVYKK